MVYQLNAMLFGCRGLRWHTAKHLYVRRQAKRSKWNGNTELLWSNEEKRSINDARKHEVLSCVVVCARRCRRSDRRRKMAVAPHTQHTHTHARLLVHTHHIRLVIFYCFLFYFCYISGTFRSRTLSLCNVPTTVDCSVAMLLLVYALYVCRINEPINFYQTLDINRRRTWFSLFFFTCCASSTSHTSHNTHATHELYVRERAIDIFIQTYKSIWWFDRNIHRLVVSAQRICFIWSLLLFYFGLAFLFHQMKFIARLYSVKFSQHMRDASCWDCSVRLHEMKMKMLETFFN